MAVAFLDISAGNKFSTVLFDCGRPPLVEAYEDTGRDCAGEGLIISLIS